MRYLWRLDGVATGPDAAGWAAGVARHLRYQPLTVIWRWRGAERRVYVALDGCPRCAAAGCAQACHRVLFAQLVRATLPGVALTPVARLTPPAAGQRGVALPVRPSAASLVAAAQAAWPAGQLLLTWAYTPGKRPQLQVGARVQVEGRAPSLRTVLRSQGWGLAPVATLRARTDVAAPQPPPVQRRRLVPPALEAALRDPWAWMGADAPRCTEETPA